MCREFDPLSRCPYLILVAITSGTAFVCVCIGARCLVPSNTEGTFSTMELHRGDNGLVPVRTPEGRCLKTQNENYGLIAAGVFVLLLNL